MNAQLTTIISTTAYKQSEQKHLDLFQQGEIRCQEIVLTENDKNVLVREPARYFYLCNFVTDYTLTPAQAVYLLNFRGYIRKANSIITEYQKP